MEDLDKALTETEEPVVESPDTEEPTEEQDEPAAGGETGETEPVIEAEPATIPRSRLNEVIEERNQLREKYEQFATLATNPIVAQAIADATGQETEAEDIAAVEYGIPNDWVPESEGEGYLATVVKKMAAELQDLRSQVKPLAADTQTRAAQEVQRQFDVAVEKVAKEAGVTLTDAEKEAIAEQAAIYGYGLQAVGKIPSLEDGVRNGFIVVRNQKVDGSADAKAAQDAKVKAQALGVGSRVPATTGRPVPNVGQETVAQTAERIAKEKGLSFGE